MNIKEKKMFRNWPKEDKVGTVFSVLAGIIIAAVIIINETATSVPLG